MANLKLFIWDGAQAGQAFDIYSGPIVKIGDGKWLKIEKLHIVIQGSIPSGIGPKKVEIIMPDEAPSGHCKVIFDGAPFNCPYEVQDKRLKIHRVADRTLELEAQDKLWSWVGVSGVPTWFGLWPQSAALDLPQFGPQEKAA